MTFKDVNVEELAKADLELPNARSGPRPRLVHAVGARLGVPRPQLAAFGPSYAVTSATLVAEVVGVRASDALGKYGEDLAVQRLQESGFEVLDRNWRCRDGEIDIVARDGSALVVCEVKTRPVSASAARSKRSPGSSSPACADWRCAGSKKTGRTGWAPSGST